MAVTGVTQMKAKLAKMPAVVESKVRDAMEKGADEIVAMMKRLVPVDDGDLRDSIGWTWGALPAGAKVVAKTRAAGPNDLRLVIYAGSNKAFYARMQEFGTQNMPANPFFFPSYRALRDRTKRRVITASRAALKQVAAGNS